MELDVKWCTDHGAAVVTAAGDIDMQTAPALTAVLGEALDRQPDCVVLDLRQVGFLDSSGLGVMVGAQKRARTQNSSVIVVAATESVLRLFRITRLTELFPIYASVDDALRGGAVTG